MQNDKKMLCLLLKLSHIKVIFLCIFHFHPRLLWNDRSFAINYLKGSSDLREFNPLFAAFCRNTLWKEVGVNEHLAGGGRGVGQGCPRGYQRVQSVTSQRAAFQSCTRRKHASPEKWVK